MVSCEWGSVRFVGLNTLAGDGEWGQDRGGGRDREDEI